MLIYQGNVRREMKEKRNFHARLEMVYFSVSGFSFSFERSGLHQRHQEKKEDAKKQNQKKQTKNPPKQNK